MRIEKYLYEAPVGRYTISVPLPDGTGTLLTLHFSESNCGTREKALREAREYRDFLLEQSGQMWKLERHAGMERHKANVTGVIGVHLGSQFRNGNEWKNWIASGDLGCQRWRRKFAVLRYGNEGAFLWACRERFKRHGPLVILNPALLPCLPDVPYRILDGQLSPAAHRALRQHTRSPAP